MDKVSRIASWSVAALLALATPVAAQYDRDGRYVPSPNGIPSDPYARPIPVYPGNPGGAIGTPIWPRGPEIPPPPKVLQTPPTDRAVRYSNELPLPLMSAKQCRQGWSRATGLTKVQFRRQCARFDRD